MNWQQIASLAIVASTAVLLVRSEVRKRRRGNLGDCGAGCNCSSANASTIVAVHGHRGAGEAEQSNGRPA